MKIRHLPNSITPYEDCGYCRVPEKPIAGDEVFLSCRIEERDCGNSVPSLQIIINGVESTAAVEGRFIRSDDKGDYYSFPLGAYSTGDRLKYQFHCPEGNKETVSDWYEFEIYRKIIYSVPSKIFYNEKSVLLQFFHEQADNLDIELQMMEEEITIRVGHPNVVADKLELTGTEKSWMREKYELLVQTAPFSISIKNKGGESLISYYGQENSLCIINDSRKVVKNIAMQCSIKADGMYGFGEKFNQVNQLGLEAKNYVYEHFTHQQEKTYMPVPFFFTDTGYGFYYETDYTVTFSTKRDGDRAVLRTEAASDKRDKLDDLHIYFGTPQDMLKQYIEKTGKCVLPPKWSFGPWMSANGWNTQKETLEQIDKMNQYQIPATVLVLEAWSDETTFYIFNGAKYTPKSGKDRLTYEDFSFDKDGMWPDPKGMTQTLHDNNVKLVLWQVPTIKYTDDRDNEQHVNDEEYVIKKSYCVCNRNGEPYRIPDKWFPGSLVPDFTNQAAKDWWFSKRRYLLEEVGVDGFKTDGGEFIYDNQAVFSNGKCGEEMRNPFPNLYTESYHEFLNQYKGTNQGVLFSRAGYKGAQKYPIHWSGDQMSDYSEFRSQLKAGLSAGLSGVIFWGFDIAGFAGDLPTTDLFLRSTAMAAFSPIMQFHSEPRTGQFFYEERRSWNNDRSPWNMAEVNKEPWIIDVYRRYANIRMNLMPYIYNEAIQCCEQGRPMLAHLILDYPEDEKVINIEDEYLFGRSILVAPVLNEGVKSRIVYLPKGIWYDFFTGEKYEGGFEYEYDCSLDKIPVFVKDGHAIALNLPKSLEIGDYVGNDVSSYQNLTVKTYGESGSLIFEDDLGYHFTLTWNSKEKKVDGYYPNSLITL